MSKPLKGWVICFTGTLSKPRKQMQKLVEQNGAKVAGTVTGAVTHVVYSSSDGTSSSKYIQGKGAGKNLLTEEKLNAVISGKAQPKKRQVDNSSGSEADTDNEDEQPKKKKQKNKRKGHDDDEEGDDDDDGGSAKKGPLSGMKICITGSMSVSREKMIKWIKSQGAKFLDTCQDATHVLWSDDGTYSSKYEKGKQKDILVTEVDLRRRCNVSTKNDDDGDDEDADEDLVGKCTLTDDERDNLMGCTTINEMNVNLKSVRKMKVVGLYSFTQYHQIPNDPIIRAQLLEHMSNDLDGDDWDGTLAGAFDEDGAKGTEDDAGYCLLQIEDRACTPVRKYHCYSTYMGGNITGIVFVANEKKTCGGHADGSFDFSCDPPYKGGDKDNFISVMGCLACCNFTSTDQIIHQFDCPTAVNCTWHKT
eukprot:TRINITY_DN57444_c0_g4_i1.p1 TRINITY_DN57444_c0_g4~~TRINITY_DN57444_c0_g4_i1.p1  ORF type:complete len:419 (+),score=76.97 TRINITY_DN57444_c0_g4_i1:46-1302(+)